jgi:DNA-binding XRE family transcriptional regulator
LRKPALPESGLTTRSRLTPCSWGHPALSPRYFIRTETRRLLAHFDDLSQVFDCEPDVAGADSDSGVRRLTVSHHLAQSALRDRQEGCRLEDVQEHRKPVGFLRHRRTFLLLRFCRLRGIISRSLPGVPARSTRRPEFRLRIFGERVRARRQSMELSQEALAHAAGIHRTYIGSVERGERNLSLGNAYALADALGTPLRDLLDPDS